jgi:predicted transcriptional regulator
MALRDFRSLKDAPAQQFLATRWGVDKSTVSRWLKDWEAEGLVSRRRIGKEKPVLLALPMPTGISDGPTVR